MNTSEQQAIQFDEDRIDHIAQNGNDGLHYDEYLKGWQRYEKLRKLTPRQFSELWLRHINGDVHFDDLVDAL